MSFTLSIEEKKAIILILSFASIFFIVSGLWAIDIGASGMALKSSGIQVYASNGWWVREPIQQYHIGLWLVGIFSLIQCLLIVLALFVGSFPKH